MAYSKEESLLNYIKDALRENKKCLKMEKLSLSIISQIMLSTERRVIE